jgi:hypothetical protein
VDDVVLEYQITWAEFRRAQIRAVPMRAVDIVGGVTLVCVLIGVTDHQPFWTYYGIVFCLVFSFLMSYVAPRRIWNSGLGFQEPVKVTINDQGIIRKSASLEIKLEWSRFQRVRESKEFFILMPRKKIGAFLILKRGLDSAVDENRLRQLLGANVLRAPRKVVS